MKNTGYKYLSCQKFNRIFDFIRTFLILRDPYPLLLLSSSGWRRRRRRRRLEWAEKGGCCSVYKYRLNVFVWWRHKTDFMAAPNFLLNTMHSWCNICVPQCESESNYSMKIGLESRPRVNSRCESSSVYMLSLLCSIKVKCIEYSSWHG